MSYFNAKGIELIGNIFKENNEWMQLLPKMINMLTYTYDDNRDLLMISFKAIFNYFLLLII